MRTVRVLFREPAVLAASKAAFLAALAPVGFLSAAVLCVVACGGSQATEDDGGLPSTAISSDAASGANGQDAAAAPSSDAGGPPAASEAQGADAAAAADTAQDHAAGGSAVDSADVAVNVEDAADAGGSQGLGAAPGDGSPADASEDACPMVSNIPDAALGTAGATTATCVACIDTSCPSQAAACNADCTCGRQVAGLVDCVASGETFAACAVTMPAGATLAALETCAVAPCAGSCGM